jgi:hypothetical protein
LEIRTSRPTGETWIKFKDKDGKRLGDIHFRYYSDGSTQAYTKAVYPCEAYESEWKEPGKNSIPKTGNKRWSIERTPDVKGSGLNVKCNNNLISTYTLPEDFKSGNSVLCPAFLNGDVQFITFISKDHSSEEYFKDNGK